jgi:tetratricopeptide (TPR) repeat protein
MRTLFTFLLVISLFCSGFTWGKSKEDRCKEANELILSQQKKFPNVLPAGLEQKVIELCPDGAARQYVNGLKSELNKQVEQAVLNYDSALKIDEHFSDAYGRKGLLQLSQNNKPAAMVSLTRALEEGGKNPHYHLALAEMLLETQAYPLSLYHYERASVLGIPYNAESLTAMAKAHSRMKNWKEAETVLRQALFYSANDPHLKARLAQAVIRQQRLAEGVQLLKQAIALKPEEKVLHQDLADALTAMGDSGAAKAELQLAGVPVVNEVESYVRQGDTYFLHRDFPAAIRSYNNAAAMHASPEIFQKLGDAYLAVGNDDDALGNYQKSLLISPDDAAMHYSAGVILERKGDIDKAVGEFERCVSLDKNNGDAHRRLAEIYSLKGDLQKAITEYKQIIEKAPDNPVMQFRLAKVYLRVGSLNDAKKSLEMAVKLAPKNLEPRRELIKVEIKRRDLPNAEKQCRGILTINRDDQQERKRLIGILGQQKKYDGLVEFLKDEISRYPDDSINYYRMGIVKEYLKDYRGAIQALLKSIEIKPTAQSYQTLARAYLSIIETEKAKEALEKARKLDPKKKDVKELTEIIEEELGHPNADGSKKYSEKKKKRAPRASDHKE